MAKSKKRNIKDEVNAFNNCKYYKETQAQIDVLTKLINALKKLNPKDAVNLAIDAGFDKQHVINLINNVIEFSEMTPEDKDELEFITEFNIYMHTKEELLLDYEKNLILWYTYLYIFQLSEDYEVCNRIMRVIKQEQCELINNLVTYFEFDAYDEEQIAELEQRIYNSIFE